MAVSDLTNSSSTSDISASAALRMSRSTLTDLFRSHPGGDIPNGRSYGTGLFAPSTPMSRILAIATKLLFWQGKDFNAAKGDLLNRLTPFGIRAIRAEVIQGTSLIDDKPCVVLDYSRTSIVAKFIRDEIRQVGPNDYLGLVFIRKHMLPVHFWLHFPPN